MDDCIFCKIANGEIPAKAVFRDERMFAFHDIAPAAPTHILIIPLKHIASISELTENDAGLVGEIFIQAARIAREQKLPHYRIIANCGSGAGQSIFHLHFHLLGGRRMGWPPG